MIEELYNILNETVITPSSTIMRLTVALVLGLCIGAERQARRRDAGLRTFTLICLGSAGAVVLSIWIPQIYPNLLNGDPGRIAAQVLTGVGFLGAGAIVRSKGGVQGLTTAACIWQTSIVGMTAGAGLYTGAALMTILTLFVLVTMERIERVLRIDGDNMMMTIKLTNTTPDIDAIISTAKTAGARLKESSVSVDKNAGESIVTFRITIGSATNHSAIIKALQQIPDVENINIVA